MLHRVQECTNRNCVFLIRGLLRPGQGRMQTAEKRTIPVHSRLGPAGARRCGVCARKGFRLHIFISLYPPATQQERNFLIYHFPFYSRFSLFPSTLYVKMIKNLKKTLLVSDFSALHRTIKCVTSPHPVSLRHHHPRSGISSDTSSPATSSMPLLSSPRNFAGLRLTITTIFLPTISSGV